MIVSFEYYASIYIYFTDDRYIITTGAVTALFSSLLGSVLPQVRTSKKDVIIYFFRISVNHSTWLWLLGFGYGFLQPKLFFHFFLFLLYFVTKLFLLSSSYMFWTFE